MEGSKTCNGGSGSCALEGVTWSAVRNAMWVPGAVLCVEGMTWNAVRNAMEVPGAVLWRTLSCMHSNHVL